ncbi:MAG TPA: hypothetical protein VGX76_10160, partial [Pirellulales bacterium]|nr:hypothetical protein [Pirellulales bacterium]
TGGPDKKPPFGADAFDLDKLPFDVPSSAGKEKKPQAAKDSLMPDTFLSDTVRRREKPDPDEPASDGAEDDEADEVEKGNEGDD